jgi:hypothetical protein
MKKLFNKIHYFFHYKLKHYETNLVRPYSLKAFQWYQYLHNKSIHGLGNFNITNKIKQITVTNMNIKHHQ